MKKLSHTGDLTTDHNSPLINRFERRINRLNYLLQTHDPFTFNSSWIRTYAPSAYRFFQAYVRTDTGGIDWDRVTRALNRRFQRRWTTSPRKVRNSYQDDAETNIILEKYKAKLYTFITSDDREDHAMRDMISIALVRMAQKGNVSAGRKIIELLSFTVAQWIECYPWISRWNGYDELIHRHIEGCIRRYRYSGSFMAYLFRTLQYAARGLRPLYAFSLDDPLYSGQGTLMDLIVQNPVTGELLIRGRRSITQPSGRSTEDRARH